jgi:3-isopropylmalate dehydrogenase
MPIKKIALLPGDGVGPEVLNEAVKVLRAIEKTTPTTFELKEGLVGAIAIHKTGTPLPNETLELCKQSDAVLFGAIGSPEFDNNPNAKVRPEQGLLKLRKELGLFANLRPIKCYAATQSISPLKESVTKGVDFLVFRELTGGIYFGAKELSADKKTASDLCLYTEEEIVRITRLAFEAAQKRKKKVTLVDKANVLETSRLWRRVVTEIAADYKEVELETMFVDNASMKLITHPASFDVILTENMFGDILTDEASVIAGSLGLIPSSSVGKNVSLYEPIHGSFPQGAGKGIANPIAAILSVAMMLDYSFGMTTQAALIENAVEAALEKGIVTQEINSVNPSSTTQVGNFIADHVSKPVFEKASEQYG